MCGEPSQPFCDSLIGRIIINLAGVPLNPVFDHNLRLAEPWVIFIYSKPNLLHYVNKSRFFAPSYSKLNRPPLVVWLASGSILKMGLAGEVGCCSGQECHRFLLFLPEFRPLSGSKFSRIDAFQIIALPWLISSVVESLFGQCFPSFYLFSERGKINLCTSL